MSAKAANDKASIFLRLMIGIVLPVGMGISLLIPQLRYSLTSWLLSFQVLSIFLLWISLRPVEVISRDPVPAGPDSLIGKDRRLIFFILIVSAMAFLGSLKNGFMGDDFILVSHARSLGESLRFWGRGNRINFRPVWGVFLSMEYAIFRERAAGYRAVNLALHLINITFLWQIVRRLAVSKAGWMAALLFSLSPLLFGSVAWCSSSDVLSTTGSLIALYFFLSWQSKSRGPASRGVVSISGIIAGWSLALLSKETALFLPVIFLVLYFSFSRAEKTSPSGKTLALLIILGLICYALSYLLSMRGILGYYVGPSGRFLARGLGPSWISAWFSIIPQILAAPLNLRLLEHPDLIHALGMMSMAVVLAGSAKAPGYALAAVPTALVMLALPLFPVLPVILMNQGEPFLIARFFYPAMIGVSLLAGIAASGLRNSLFASLFIFCLAVNLWGLTHNLKRLADLDKSSQKMIEQLHSALSRSVEKDSSILIEGLPRYENGLPLMNGTGEEIAAAVLDRDLPSGLKIFMPAVDPSSISRQSPDPIDQYRHYFLWDSDRGILQDVTDDTRRALALRDELLQQEPGIVPLTVFEQSPGKDAVELVDMIPDGKTGFSVTGPDPQMLFPSLSVSAAIVDRVEVTMKITPASELARAMPLTQLFWTGEKNKTYQEAQSLTLTHKTDGSLQTLSFPVGNKLTWLLQGRITRIRLDPAAHPATVKIISVRLIPTIGVRAKP